ncbi:hypothetical protein [Pseudomarimonas arenosa]|uniref:DUF3185 family protein n=1 Tax=Pseudomarimonas arenosa TaxID=2774145 RepID=A0AAW3ZJ17_9GAMM|nr:hypothetical protein [Pseudomarimonas arenosa]MBD8525219.1 hypothetical protein [Pseudomarimonas arenosa]
MRMRYLLPGVLLILLGILSLIGKLSWQEDKELVRIGDAELSVKQERSPADWVGYGLLFAGGVLVVGGLASRRP